MSYVFFLLFSFYGEIEVYACSPLEPVLIPPADRKGEFIFVYPPTFVESMMTKVVSGKNIAVIKANLVWSTKPVTREYAEVEILYGWGYQKGHLLKLYRQNYFCGEFVSLREGAYYVATMENGMPVSIIEFKKVERALESRGEPEYVFTAIGLLK